jgi:hypothetical protein
MNRPSPEPLAPQFPRDPLGPGEERAVDLVGVAEVLAVGALLGDGPRLVMRLQPASEWFSNIFES